MLHANSFGLQIPGYSQSCSRPTEKSRPVRARSWTRPKLSWLPPMPDLDWSATIAPISNLLEQELRHQPEQQWHGIHLHHRGPACVAIRARIQSALWRRRVGTPTPSKYAQTRSSGSYRQLSAVLGRQTAATHLASKHHVCQPQRPCRQTRSQPRRSSEGDLP